MFSFVSNKVKGTIPFYLTLTDTSMVSAYTTSNEYLRIWKITNLRTGDFEYLETTSASINYCISADSNMNDSYTVSMSAVI